MQSKIGFDKYPVPSIITEVPLNDIVTGLPLVDSGGIGLVARTERTIVEIARSEKALSVVFDPPTMAPISIAELFRETTETSTTLLGVDRSETQLSLFADVSTLGLDPSHWEVFNYRDGLAYGPWDSRGTAAFGPHYDATMVEQTQEQSLELGSFPVPYSFPFPPRFADIGYYNEPLYRQFINFILLGNSLYTTFGETSYVTIYGPTFRDQFLDPGKVTINNDKEIQYTGVTEGEGLVLIDTWTRTWVDINSNLLLDPTKNDGSRIDANFINTLTGQNPDITITRPGYSSSINSLSLLQSRKSFRYQPGRISGFTFGIKASTDSGSSSNIIEWGISNPTDQYVFQIRGASLSIVRRSTIPLETSALVRSGSPEQTYVPSGNPFDIDPNTGELKKYYTITISRDSFNTDQVNGNGPSGYLLNPAFVTMYKIEFGWYGAIGARFYAYIPVGNGEARWVVLHTIVIENSLGKPCLEDPFFKFLYQVNIADTSTLRTPQFLYKYGASMYIDGGDVGTVTQHSYSSSVSIINTNYQKSVLGIYPKTDITNIEGITRPNKKLIIPKQLLVASDVLTKVEIIKCRACTGFGHNYNQGLVANDIGRTFSIRFTETRDRIQAIEVDEDTPSASRLFQLSDVGSKIIADGVYATYIRSIDPTSAVFVGESLIGYETALIERVISTYIKTPSSVPEKVFSRIQNQLIDVPIDTTYPHPIRLVKYDAIAASLNSLSGSTIKFQFLNPLLTGSLGHFNEFMLGITDKRPVEVFEEDLSVLKWEYGEDNLVDQLDDNDIIFGEWMPSYIVRDRNGYEIGEGEEGAARRAEIDYRIPQPPGEGTGICSEMTVNVLQKTFRPGTLFFGNPANGAQDGWYIRLNEGIRFPNATLINGEIGVNNISTGVFFISEQNEYRVGLSIFYYAKVSGQISGISSGQSVVCQFTPISLVGRYISAVKIFKFNPYPLYMFVKMRSNARVNSISISEIIGESVAASSPKWVTNLNMSTDNYGGLAESQLPPTAFSSQDRRDGAAIDTQLQQQLRPGSVVDTFFIDSNRTANINLQNIYGADRETITPDIFNIEATFFTAKVIPIPGQDTTGSVQVTLNTSEQ